VSLPNVEGCQAIQSDTFSLNPHRQQFSLSPVKASAQAKRAISQQGGAAMLTRFLFEEDGQTLVEYGLLISLLALVAVGAVTLLGRRTLAFYNNANNQLPQN
jgi:pilus assembly protein Flp/PilA